MSITDLPPDVDSPALANPGRGIDRDPDADVERTAREGLTQDTAASEWDVSEIAGPSVPEAPANQAVPPPAEPAQIPGTRPTFTITEAAGACAVSRKTITRKLTDLAEHGAAKDDDGVWRIPVEALLAVGLHPGRSVPASSRPSSRPASSRPAASTTPRSADSAMPSPTPAVPRPAADPGVVTISRDRWDDLRLRLARAEAEAAERALALADARLALRALTAAPAAPQARAGLSFVDATGTDMSPAGPGVPAAAGWVMQAVRPPAQHSIPTGAASAGVDDPGAAPPVAVVAPPARRRRWWQSAR